ncbi:C40 family peptidase [Winogradskya consettensis]|uniref:C40 family peptidase n=1 Tax=Winogradskya consettensis TaxID=113560 RepID=UPI001BB390CF|nr:VCBS repeat-containing protein [Actinoplanes consettensis]
MHTSISWRRRAAVLVAAPLILMCGATAASADPADPPSDPPLASYPSVSTQEAPNPTARAATVQAGFAGCDDNGPALHLTREQVLARAQTWLDVGVPYSQENCYRNSLGDYRTDCSGFVSMAWGLGGEGSDYWTGNLYLVTTEIARSALKPGDALLRPDDHVALFVRWADSAHTQPEVIEQTGTRNTIRDTWSQSNAARYTPVRVNTIVDKSQSAPALMYDNGGGSTHLFRWTSNGSAFARTTEYVGNSYNAPSVGDRMASGDVDGDGVDDLVTAYQKPDGQWQMNVFRGGVTSAGIWYDGGTLNLDKAGGRLVVGDWNGDGKAEPALLYDKGGSNTYIYRWLSTGSSFQRTTEYESTSFALAAVGDRVDSGDIDGDGDDDIVTAHQNNDGKWQLNVFRSAVTSAGIFYNGGSLNLDNAAGRLVVADFNGDGKAEPALAYDNNNGTMHIYRWTSTGTAFSRTTDYDADSSFSLSNVGNRVDAADVDGDGSADIVMAYQKPAGDWQLNVFRNGLTSAGTFYNGGTLDLDKVGGRLALGAW